MMKRESNSPFLFTVTDHQQGKRSMTLYRISENLDLIKFKYCLHRGCNRYNQPERYIVIFLDIFPTRFECGLFLVNIPLASAKACFDHREDSAYV